MLASEKDPLLLDKKMKNSKVKEYLNMFPDDADFNILIANPKERKLYPVKDIGGINDMGFPVLCVEVGHEQDMDADMIEACEEDERNAENLEGQMELADFPE